MLRLSLFDWAGFVEQGFFVGVVSGAVAAGFALSKPENLPPWMITSTPLVFVSLVLAFTRVWKTSREERETGALWETFGEVVSPRGAGLKHLRDAVFEIPYVFSIAVLPVSIVSLQTFVMSLLIFYISDNYYNLALARGVGGDDSIAPFVWLRWLQRLGTGIGRRVGGVPHAGLMLLGAALEGTCSTLVPRENSVDRLVLVRFFARRARLDIIAIWLLAAVMALALFGARDVAAWVGLLALATLLVMELAVEPFRGLGVQYEAEVGATRGRLLWTLPPRARLDAASRATVTAIHEEAFLPPERQITAERMLDHAQGNERLMLVTQGECVAGYLFVEARPKRRIVFFWYLAIDETRRAQGLGTFLVTHALEVVRERWPTCRAVFLETARPPSADDPTAEENRRVRFYNRLGFFRVTGVSYEIPAADEPLRSLSYDPMFYLLDGSRERMDIAFVRKSVLEMARDNFANQPADPRWAALKASTARMKIVAPSSPAS